LEYRTEHEYVIEYLENLNLYEYIGRHDSERVVVLGDSGYDNKKIEKAIDEKGWKYIIALKKKRSVKTEKEFTNTAKSQDWSQVQQLFKKHRWIKWVTVYLPKCSPKKKRMEFRIRQTTGYLRYVGKAQLVCSEFKKRPQGKRKYLASNDLKATPRQILLAYRIRWRTELYHHYCLYKMKWCLFVSFLFDPFISYFTRLFQYCAIEKLIAGRKNLITCQLQLHFPAGGELLLSLRA
jgi:hypothetical protein